jgi:hypothetical protein
MFSKLLASTRTFFESVLEAVETFLLFPVLIGVLLISLFASMPKLGQLFANFWKALSGGDPALIDLAALNVLVLPIMAFLTLALLRHRLEVTREFKSVHKEFEGRIKTLVDSVQGVEYLEFKNEIDRNRHLNKITAEAKREVADLTWAHRRPGRLLPSRTPEEQAEIDRLDAEHADIVSNISKTRNYREIFILSRPDRIQKLRRRLRERSPRYYCTVLSDAVMPRQQFVIVDKTEVVFASSIHNVLCSVKHPKLVQIFTDYFEDAWAMGPEIVTTADGRARWDEKATMDLISAAEMRLAQGVPLAS